MGVATEFQLRIALTPAEDRERELDGIRLSLVGSSVADQLYINTIGGRHFVGIRGDAGGFAKAGSLEAMLAAVIATREVVQFGFAASTKYYDADASGLFAFVRSIPGFCCKTSDIGQRFSGGVTHSTRVSLTGMAQVWVDPTDLRDLAAVAQKIPISSLGEAVAHELLGHAYSLLLRGGADYNDAAIKAENLARTRTGPQRGVKTKHGG